MSYDAWKTRQPPEPEDTRPLCEVCGHEPLDDDTPEGENRCPDCIADAAEICEECSGFSKLARVELGKGECDECKLERVASDEPQTDQPEGDDLYEGLY